MVKGQRAKDVDDVDHTATWNAVAQWLKRTVLRESGLKSICRIKNSMSKDRSYYDVLGHTAI